MWALILPMRPFNGQFGMQGKDSAALSMEFCVFEKRKGEKERESKLVGNPCLTLMLNVGLFYFTDCGKHRRRDTRSPLCEAVNLHICLEEAEPWRLLTQNP